LISSLLCLKHDLEGFFGDVLSLVSYKTYTPCGTNKGYMISSKVNSIYNSGDTYIVGNIPSPDVTFLSMDGVRTLNEKEAVKVINRIQQQKRGG